MSDSQKISYGGHWPVDVKSLEHLSERVGGLKHQIDDVYDSSTTAGLDELDQRLNELSESLSEDTEENRRQLRSLMKYTARFRKTASSRFLELQTEIDKIQSSFEDIKKQAKADAELKAQEISLKKWELIVSVLLVFLGGVLVPVILYLLGIPKP